MPLAKEKFEIDICPIEGRASVITDHADHGIISEALRADLLNCTEGGDVENVCRYVLNNYDVVFGHVSRGEDGQYRHAPATDKAISDTAREIYFDSESDFDDVDLAKVYLVWGAACSEEDEITACVGS